jgi:hypothetical protein
MGQWLNRGPFCLGCSLPALNVVSHWHYIALVCLRLGDAVAFAKRLKPRQILISARVLMKVEDAVKVEPAGEFVFKGIRRPLAAYDVVAAVGSSD